MSSNPQNKTLIVIAGPTAVGKTAVALELALRFQCEIISADSRQFFRELNIGTAKPTGEELQHVRHHFINSHSITSDYDAAQYGIDALAKVQEILAISSYAILCGGSGLYIKAVTHGFDDIPEVDPSIRESLINGYQVNGLVWLQEKMKAEDPDWYAQVDQQNPHRLIRALEVKLGTGTSISTYRKNSRRIHDFNIVKVGLELPREELFQRIDYRMDQMIDQGLFEEAEQLQPYKHHNALQTVGYQEIFDCFDGKYDRDEAIRLLKRNSRRYAKRQLTWFKRDPEMKWFHPSEIDNIVNWISNTEMPPLRD